MRYELLGVSLSMTIPLLHSGPLESNVGAVMIRTGLWGYIILYSWQGTPR